MAFKKIEYIQGAESVGLAHVSVNRYGSITLSPAFIEQNKLGEYTHCDIFFDEGEHGGRQMIKMMMYTSSGNMRYPLIPWRKNDPESKPGKNKKPVQKNTQSAMQVKCGKALQRAGLVLPEKAKKLTLVKFENGGDTMILAL